MNRRLHRHAPWLIPGCVALLTVVAGIVFNHHLVEIRLQEMDALLNAAAQRTSVSTLELAGRYRLILDRIRSGEESIEAYRTEARLASFEAELENAPIGPSPTSSPTGEGKSMARHGVEATLRTLRRLVGKPTVGEAHGRAPNATIQRAYLLERRRRWQEAIDAYESVLHGDAVPPAVRHIIELHVGFSYSMLGRFDDARERFSRVARESTDPGLTREATQLLMVLGQVEQTILEHTAAAVTAVSTGPLAVDGALLRGPGIVGTESGRRASGGTSSGSALSGSALSGSALSGSTSSGPRTAIAVAPGPNGPDDTDDLVIHEEPRQLLARARIAFLSLQPQRTIELVEPYIQTFENDGSAADHPMDDAAPYYVEARYYRARAWEEMGRFSAADAEYRSVQRLAQTLPGTLPWAIRAERRRALLREFYLPPPAPPSPSPSPRDTEPISRREATSPTGPSTVDIAAADAALDPFAEILSRLRRADRVPLQESTVPTPAPLSNAPATAATTGRKPVPPAPDVVVPLRDTLPPRLASPAAEDGGSEDEKQPTGEASSISDATARSPESRATQETPRPHEQPRIAAADNPPDLPRRPDVRRVETGPPDPQPPGTPRPVASPSQTGPADTSRPLASPRPVASPSETRPPDPPRSTDTPRPNMPRATGEPEVPHDTVVGASRQPDRSVASPAPAPRPSVPREAPVDVRADPRQPETMRAKPTETKPEHTGLPDPVESGHERYVGHAVSEEHESIVHVLLWDDRPVNADEIVVFYRAPTERGATETAPTGRPRAVAPETGPVAYGVVIARIPPRIVIRLTDRRESEAVRFGDYVFASRAAVSGSFPAP